MAFDKEQEKQRALRMVEGSLQDENSTEQQDKKSRAIAISLEEAEEIKNEIDGLIAKLDHLVVFQELVKPHLVRFNAQTNQQTIHMMQKDYSKEELAEMPEAVYKQVVELQTRRVDVLKKIAQQYPL